MKNFAVFSAAAAAAAVIFLFQTTFLIVTCLRFFMIFFSLNIITEWKRKKNEKEKNEMRPASGASGCLRTLRMC